MSKPIVAIVGRPNVGKSTLFNYLSGERISIVDSTPGITRDRIYAESEWRGRTFSLIDTGGLEPRSDDPLLVQMQKQVQIAIKTADVILFMVDRTTGPTASDEDVADLLRRSGKPVLLVVNKVDQIGELPSDVYAFYSLGLGELYPISAEHRLGVGELLDALYAFFPPEDSEDEIHDRIRVAVIGKPNVGKSSLVNAMLGEQRLIVTDKPGTTRDAVDTDLDHELGRYTLIDTAGLRKKSRIDTAVEKYSMIRALAAIDRSDVCLIMIDATEGITEQDTKVAGFAHNKGKASIFVVNKWDLVEKTAGSAEKWQKEIRSAFSFMTYAPVLFISAKTGFHLHLLFGLIHEVYGQAGKRLPTGLFNEMLSEAMAISPPPQDKGRQLKIYYGTQVGTYPPRFALFINDRKLMHFSYERYLENQIRKSFDFTGTPIWLLLRPKGENSST